MPHAKPLQRVGPSESLSHIPSARRVLNVGTVLMAVRMAGSRPSHASMHFASYKGSVRGHWFVNSTVEPHWHQSSRLIGVALIRLGTPSLPALASVLSFSTCANARVAQHRVGSESDSTLEETQTNTGGVLQRGHSIASFRSDRTWSGQLKTCIFTS
ncbi:hypothetical protein K458DRAFT_425220 [Lentithecium fluviatile CBS 122367]|uniref:Uncharacterized protein n=1 Tax=Lentithecium fluviatile CBS 122367 TaxID=1168545 RepID=A0A6G1ICX5_9PLEO|nr:hypothetical protein K458DRAFT_425220 [Lentithecium fluviatile CBS 122367]